MATKRQLWAQKRNWLLMRLRGSLSVFSGYNQEFISKLIDIDKSQRLYMVESDIKYLIKEISKSKYKEKDN